MAGYDLKNFNSDQIPDLDSEAFFSFNKTIILVYNNGE